MCRMIFLSNILTWLNLPGPPQNQIISANYLPIYYYEITNVCFLSHSCLLGQNILYLDSHPLPTHCFLLQFHNLFYILRYFFKIPSDFYENGQKINYICLPPSPYFLLTGGWESKN